MSRMENNKKQKQASRLRELLDVLRRRDILHGVTPVKVRQILEDMGPTYVKLGQIMSMRSDILPQTYCDELSKLQATVRATPFADVERILEEEYGKPWRKIFSSIDQKPLGSASIAQVYRAVLQENQAKVVIKVQRPHIYETMARDIKLMHRALSILKVIGPTADVLDFDAILNELWTVAQQEMDFLLEAQHNEEFAKLNQEIVYVHCPEVYRSLTTSRVLVMEQIEGIPIDHLEELEAAGYDLHEIGMKLAANYCKQVMDDAFFHADPHPGNIWISGGKIIFLDLGMMGRLTARDRSLFREAVKAVARYDAHTLKEILLTIGNVNGKINHTELYTDTDDMLRKYADAELSSINLGKLVQELLDLAKRHNIGMPSSITMLARGVMTIEGVMSKCCPEISLLQILKSHLSGEILQNFHLKHELKKVGQQLYDTASKGIDIPVHLSDFLKMAVKGQAKVNLEIVGSEEPLQKISSMVNKLVTCILAASILMGSSIICTTDMKPKVLGIPFLGFLGFVAALVLCGKLVVDTVFSKKKK